MQDGKSFEDLKEKSLEIILNFKPLDKYDKTAVNEIQKLKSDIKKAIILLPKEERDIIEFRYYLNLTPEQIAKNTGKSEDEINKSILNAIDRIRINLKHGIAQNKSLTNSSEISKVNLDENLIKDTQISNGSYRVGLMTTIIFIGLVFFGGYFLLQNKDIFSGKYKFLGGKIQKLKTNETQNKNPNKIKISGSTSLLLLSRRWQNIFAIDLPTYHVDLIPSDSNKGILNLIEGKVDVANSSRPVTYTDQKLAAKNELNLIEHRVALDALVIIVNKKNPIEEISLDALENIFNRVTNNWQYLININEAILPVVREKGSGTNDFVINRVLQGNDFSSSIPRKNSNKEIINFVASNSNAIGFINSTSYPWDNKEIKYLKVKNYEDSTGYSPFEGQKLNEQSIRYGDYPLSHYLYFVTTSESQKNVDDFISWVLSPKGQAIVRYSGLIPVAGG